MRSVLKTLIIIGVLRKRRQHMALIAGAMTMSFRSFYTDLLILF